MIRLMEQQDMDAVLEIWLKASILAHDFVPAQYWIKRQESVKEEYMPRARTWVYEEAGVICGFISLMPGNFIGAVFVMPDEQGRGIGRRLLERVKEEADELSLTVYEKNRPALAFYQANGFQILRRLPAEPEGEWEVLMNWQKT